VIIRGRSHPKSRRNGEGSNRQYKSDCSDRERESVESKEWTSTSIFLGEPARTGLEEQWEGQ
jgi:hypothetical protein